MAVIYSATGKYGKAVEVLERLTQAFPDDAAAYYHLGMAHSYLDHDQHALACFKRALALDPHDRRARHMVEVLSEAANQSQRLL